LHFQIASSQTNFRFDSLSLPITPIKSKKKGGLSPPLLFTAYLFIYLITYLLK
jgi:hypothetical protein